MIAVAVPKATPPPVARLRASCAGTGRRGVPATVTLRRTALDDLHDELVAERAESCDFGVLALECANRIHVAVAGERPDVVLMHAGRLGLAAGRFLRQRGAS